MEDLVLGWCQGYNGILYHMEEAYIEKQIDLTTVNLVNNPSFAIFSKKYCEDIAKLNHNKIYDYCFIGSILSNSEERQWIIDFAKKKFTDNSIFINTDNNIDWKLLGSFDKTNVIKGYCPKKQIYNQSKQVQYRVIAENIDYFQTMCQSRFILCPAGDAPWSFRFYETLMCKSIPIVKTWHHTYRTREESTLKYKYILSDSEMNISSEQYETLVSENTTIFEKNHML